MTFVREVFVVGCFDGYVELIKEPNQATNLPIDASISQINEKKSIILSKRDKDVVMNVIDIQAISPYKDVRFQSLKMIKRCFY